MMQAECQLLTQRSEECARCLLYSGLSGIEQEGGRVLDLPVKCLKIDQKKAQKQMIFM